MAAFVDERREQQHASAATTMSDSVSAGTVDVGDISAKGPWPWTTDHTARIVADEQRDPGSRSAKPDGRPEQKRKLQRQRRLTRNGAKRRKPREQAAKIRGPHDQQAHADGCRLGNPRPATRLRAHRGKPVATPTIAVTIVS